MAKEGDLLVVVGAYKVACFGAGPDRSQPPLENPVDAGVIVYSDGNIAVSCSLLGVSRQDNGLGIGECGASSFHLPCLYLRPFSSDTLDRSEQNRLQDEVGAFLDADLRDLHLPQRIGKVLAAAHIDTIDKLMCMLSNQKLDTLPGIGQKSEQYVLDRLIDYKNARITDEDKKTIIDDRTQEYNLFWYNIDELDGFKVFMVGKGFTTGEAFGSLTQSQLADYRTEYSQKQGKFKTK